MTETGQKIDMKASNTITNQVLKYTPPRNAPLQPHAKTLSAKQFTPKLSNSNSTINVTGEASRTKHRD